MPSSSPFLFVVSAAAASVRESGKAASHMKCSGCENGLNMEGGRGGGGENTMGCYSVRPG